MSDFFKAYRARLERNQEALFKLANDVLDLDPEVEVYFNSANLDRIKSSVTFFKGENINAVAFHEVPYRWSGCGYDEFRRSHAGGENVSMPFTAEDVLKTFTPITQVHKQHNTFYTSKEQYLKSSSWKERYYKTQSI